MTSGTASSPVALADLQSPVAARLAEVRQYLQRLIAADFPLISQVNTHLLQMQGKMLRPTLLLLANEATTPSPPERSVALASVVELIHLATLVHDDSVDHSVLRRGMPTINSLFSHQISVIMGDYLYSRAVIELVRLSDLPALRVLARVTNEMTVGEMRQLLAHDKLAFSEEDYDLLITAKTASLISGACEVGALGGTPAEQAAMRRFGECLGKAFQIVDDLLDYQGEAAQTGKPSGLDLREHKVTLPLIHALPMMSRAERSRVEALMADPEPGDAQITAVMSAVAARGGLHYAQERARSLCVEAEAALDRIRPGPARDTLRSSLTYVLERRS
ncbi:MAG TPA: polyprenyl synthetase family protein [Gemmatimonadales bacterium]|nr:polyprenyl synthetase family protein [Gemmatimonadales bacterium]